jgi:hypothetical protein
MGSSATSALYGRAGPVTFGIAPKVTKNASPCTPLHPPVLATGGMRRTAHESFAIATHSVCRRRIYDRPLLRSSARAEGAVDLIFDRFAMGFTRARMRASGLRCFPIVAMNLLIYVVMKIGAFVFAKLIQISFKLSQFHLGIRNIGFTIQYVGCKTLLLGR